jgi:hypothetical protein
MELDFMARNMGEAAKLQRSRTLRMPAVLDILFL